ncbi:MAG TPA: zf-HC2 domain-containing protein, partial [Acidobacteriota bacterium]|nr:zf-HC2 domain-containing protein [Acidobacteriota bacterium]
MNCSRFETLLSDYLEEALDSRVRAALDLHLQVCPDCSSLVDAVRSVRSQLAELPQIEPTEELIE